MPKRIQTGARIDERLLAAARKEADERGCSLGRVLEDALRRHLDPRHGGVVVTRKDGRIDKLATQRAQRERGR